MVIHYQTPLVVIAGNLASRCQAHVLYQTDWQELGISAWSRCIYSALWCVLATHLYTAAPLGRPSSNDAMAVPPTQAGRRQLRYRLQLASLANAPWGASLSVYTYSSLVPRLCRDLHYVIETAHLVWSKYASRYTLFAIEWLPFLQYACRKFEIYIDFICAWLHTGNFYFVLMEDILCHFLYTLENSLCTGSAGEYWTGYFAISQWARSFFKFNGKGVGQLCTLQS